MNPKLPSVSTSTIGSPLSLSFRYLACMVAVWTSLSSGAVAAGEITVYLGTNAAAYGDPNGDYKSFFQTGAIPLTASLTSNSHGDLGSTAYGNGYASADYGILKARGEGASNLGGVGGAGAEISFSDVLVFHSSPDLNGKGGYVTTNWLAIWDLNAGVAYDPVTGGKAYAAANLDVRFGSGAGGVSESVECLGANAECQRKQDLEKAFTVSTPIVFGEDTTLAAYFFIGAGAITGSNGANFHAAAIGDRSAYWDGIKSVTFDGQPVAFTVTSGSGTDYSRSFVPTSAVPAPPAFWLLISGLFPIAWAGRRKRSPHTA